jgi:hypothetical protein
MPHVKLLFSPLQEDGEDEMEVDGCEIEENDKDC